ncbi:protein kinase [Anaeromyxobacter sp. Fw109-5]|uniref:protein kinase domain-containing protein n=1 Tax=Anaeromyxobacter sp. (strain Fw109-5) TaxID=404589 RepID=UPI0000ED7008|nr:protein kinase [Anaeromyxobacter sp. Fw109-5]ABS27739.1 protein kinase [Anaeromyxobacter sp. Fw109-5]
MAGGPDPKRPAPPELAGESEAMSALLMELASAPARDPGDLATPFAAGQRVGRFELLREVGRGGFGVVFEARDTELGRLVAFKAMRPSLAQPDELERPLREEAEAAARLNHPNVVTLHDYGLHEGTPFLILELLRGETLQQRLRRGAIAPLEAVRLARDVARGLVHAHAQGVVHRDLKPGNVFLTDEGGLKILDFGLARLLDRASLAGGTPAYMAPEQLRGAPGDARADVFSAAVMLFQMLAGRLPFPVVGGRCTVLDPGPPPPLPLVDPPPELAALLASALSRDPAGRPQSASALRAALEGVEESYTRRAARASRALRHRRLRRVAAALGGLAIAATSGAAFLALRARADSERALRASRIASAAEGASDPLTAALLMTELGDDPPPRALEIAQRILAEPIPVAVLEHPPGGLGLAISPDGRQVAVGAAAARAGGGAAETGVAISSADGRGGVRVLTAPGGRVNAVAFTPDGTRVVAASHDGEVRVFRADGSSAPLLLQAGSSPHAVLAVDPGGRTAAVGALDGRAWLVALDAARPAQPLVHDGAVLALAYAPDGARLATGSGDGHLRIFDARSGALLERVTLPGGAVFALAWSRDGRAIATGSEDGVARLFGADGRPRAAFGATGAPLSTVAFSPDSLRIATASQDGSARVYPIASPAQEVRLRGHRGSVSDARFSPDGRRVLTVSGDGTVRVWPADGEGPTMVLRGHPAFEASFSPDGARIFTRGKDHTVRVWTAEDPRDRGVLRGHGDLVDTVEWTRDGARVVTAGHDGTARIWPVHGEGAPLVIADPGRVLHAADLDPDERRLVTASEDGVVRLWDARDGRLLRELRGHTSSVLSAAFSPDGSRIASASLDGTVRVWPVAGDAPPVVLTGHEKGITSVCWTPDGRAVVSASQLDATVRIWPLDGSAARVIRAERSVFRATVTPDGTRLLVAEENGPLHVYRLDTLGELPPIAALPEGLFSAAASPDGARIALTSHDGIVRVYRASGEGEPLVLRGHDGSVGHATFSPDGSELATASVDGTARVWPVSWDRVLALLRAATTACLPVGHRIQILGESAAEAERSAAACERLHGRAPEPPRRMRSTPSAGLPSVAPSRGG